MSESSIADRLSTINTKLTGILRNANTQLTDKGKPTVSDISEIPTAMSELKNPTGTINITENGTVDVTNYAEANVNVSGGSSEYNAKVNEVFSSSNKTVIKNIVKLPTLDLRNVTSINFNGYSSLISLSLINTNKLTSLNNLCYNCSSLSSISLDDISSVNYSSSTFYGCTNLRAFPAINSASKIKDTTSMFYNCSNLTEVGLFDISKAETTNAMFNGCSRLISVPEFDTSSVTNMGFMFANCSQLISIPLFNTNKVTNMSCMFMNCTNLATIPILDTSSVKNMDTMFSSCSSLSDESLENIMEMCIEATSYTGAKNLSSIGLNVVQRNKCKTLSNYQAFLDAGWSAS